MNKKKLTKRLSKQLKKLTKRYEEARAERKDLNKALKKVKKKETALEIELIALREEMEQALQIEEVPREEAPAEPEPPIPVADEDLRIEADDLRQLHGLGPKVERLLHDAGIYTFGEVANLSDDEWRTILQPAGPRFRRFDPTPWREQAAAAAQGDNGRQEDNDSD